MRESVTKTVCSGVVVVVVVVVVFVLHKTQENFISLLWHIQEIKGAFIWRNQCCKLILLHNKN